MISREVRSDESTLNASVRTGTHDAECDRMNYHHSPAANGFAPYYDSSPHSSGEFVYCSPWFDSTPYVNGKGTSKLRRSYSSGKRPGPNTSRKQTRPIHIYNETHYMEPKQMPRHTDSSFARRPSMTTKSPQSSSKPSYSKAAPKASEEDAIKWGIPRGYSIKNWDPTELPIILLGSVFDANSLGKWIYDWTVYHHGASTPMADVAAFDQASREDEAGGGMCWPHPQHGQRDGRRLH
jgi:hypothetical protein